MFGVMNITVPIREFLEWIASNHPEHAMLLNGIRDQYFGGDHREDYGYMMDPPSWRPPSMEEREIMELARAVGHAAREAKRVAFEAEEAKTEALLDESWRPFLDHEQVLMAEKALQIQRSRELSADWKTFILERESWRADRSVREKRERAELEAREAILLEEAIAWSHRWGELTARVRTRAHALDVSQ